MVHRYEETQPPFCLCLHERDFGVGNFVADNIDHAINTSRRMILVSRMLFCIATGATWNSF